MSISPAMSSSVAVITPCLLKALVPFGQFLSKYPPVICVVDSDDRSTHYFFAGFSILCWLHRRYEIDDTSALDFVALPSAMQIIAWWLQRQESCSYAAHDRVYVRLHPECGSAGDQMVNRAGCMAWVPLLTWTCKMMRLRAPCDFESDAQSGCTDYRDTASPARP